jgi:hypothetical protein
MRTTADFQFFGPGIKRFQKLFIMVPRPKKDTLESLRVTLQQLEQTADPACDAESMAQLKRILMNRIADLELLEALTSDDVQSVGLSSPAELVPPATVDTSLPGEDEKDSTHPDVGPIEKLD